MATILIIKDDRETNDAICDYFMLRDPGLSFAQTH